MKHTSSLKEVLYTDWCERVTDALFCEGDLFRNEIRTVEKEVGELAHGHPLRAPGFPHKCLEWMWGEEPREAFEAGDSSEIYATVLLARMRER